MAPLRETTARRAASAGSRANERGPSAPSVSAKERNCQTLAGTREFCVCRRRTADGVCDEERSERGIRVIRSLPPKRESTATDRAHASIHLILMGEEAEECMYVCRKVKNSQARTGHQRGMGGRKTDDDDTHERHTDTNKLTRHTASGLPHILSGRTHHSGHVPPVAPPQHSKVPRDKQQHNNTDRRQGRTCETRAGLLRL